MKTKLNSLWYVAIALGWIFDFLFWKKAPGINFALFSSLCLLGGLYLLLSDGLRPNKKTLLLLPFLAFFAATTFIRAEPMTTFLAYTFTLFVMSLLAITYLGGKWFMYGLADYFNGFLHLLGSMIARPLIFSGDVRKAQSEAGMPPSKRNIWPVVRGIIIALPIVAIFASLLASADVVFSQKLDNFIALFNLERLPEYIFRFVY